MVLQDQGELDEAQEMFERAISIQEAAYGLPPPDTLLICLSPLLFLSPPPTHHRCPLLCFYLECIQFDKQSNFLIRNLAFLLQVRPASSGLGGIAQQFVDFASCSRGGIFLKKMDDREGLIMC
jgi:hypothetical protein